MTRKMTSEDRRYLAGLWLRELAIRGFGTGYLAEELEMNRDTVSSIRALRGTTLDIFRFRAIRSTYFRLGHQREDSPGGLLTAARAYRLGWEGSGEEAYEFLLQLHE